MNVTLRQAYESELAAARTAEKAGRLEAAFHHLERAHILSQQHTLQHVWTHWLMLRLGASMGSCREVFGQAARIVAAALFSRIWVPLGNTGRANVSAVEPMPIPDDLRGMLARSRPGAAPWR